MRLPGARWVKLVVAVTASVLLLGGFVTYQVANRGAPSFRRGGEFVTTPRSGGTDGSVPATTAAPTEAPSSVSVSSTTAAARAGSPTPATPSATAQPSPTTTTARTAQGGAAADQPEAAPGPAAPPPPSAGSVPPPPSAPVMPALGTYTYAVEGEEKASVFGSRRFPDRMTTVIHHPSDLEADQLVFDLHYSEAHEEREIVGYRVDGVYFDFEGGSVSFGPRTETSEADYDPPILQVPWPLRPGSTRTGTTEAKRDDGSVVRTEDWTVTVLGTEPVEALGTTVQAWKLQVDRRSRPGSAETVTRQRTYWYDPARGLWVRFTEKLHGERQAAGFPFTYDANVSASLVGFAPATGEPGAQPGAESMRSPDPYHAQPGLGPVPGRRLGREPWCSTRGAKVRGEPAIV